MTNAHVYMRVLLLGNKHLVKSHDPGLVHPPEEPVSKDKDALPAVLYHRTLLQASERPPP